LNYWFTQHVIEWEWPVFDRFLQWHQWVLNYAYFTVKFEVRCWILMTYFNVFCLLHLTRYLYFYFYLLMNQDWVQESTPYSFSIGWGGIRTNDLPFNRVSSLLPTRPDFCFTFFGIIIPILENLIKRLGTYLSNLRQ